MSIRRLPVDNTGPDSSWCFSFAASLLRAYYSIGSVSRKTRQLCHDSKLLIGAKKHVLITSNVWWFASVAVQVSSGLQYLTDEKWDVPSGSILLAIP